MREMNIQYIMRLSLIFAFVCLGEATPVIMWEDFDDGNGNGAFDPAFVHTISGFDEYGISEYEIGDFLHCGREGGVPDGNFRLFVDGFQDYITFNLEPGQYVSHASVSHVMSHGRITFVGQYDSSTYSGAGWLDVPWIVTEADMSEIGSIQAIILSEHTFDDIRITVVPEPATWMLFVLGVVITGVFTIKNRKDLFREFSVFRG